MRYTVNKHPNSLLTSSQSTSASAQVNSSPRVGGPLKKDGTPDMRYAVKLSRRKSLSPLAPGSCLSRALRKLNFRICCEKMLLLFCHIYSAAWRKRRKSEKVNLFAVRVNNKLSSKLGAKTKLNKSLLTF